MVRVVIDNQGVDVEPGSTVLDVARKLGIDIPALCHVPGRDPSVSCMACLVKIKGINRLMPSCATVVEEGQEIESETEELRRIRKTSIELLLSDHPGDCIGPCQHACPASVDLPRVLRSIGAGKISQAADIVGESLPLPGIACRLCPQSCERGCRRREVDKPVSVAALAMYAVDSEQRIPVRQKPTGCKVAIAGSGPAGLAAAWHLHILGHDCEIYERNLKAGGSLRSEDISKKLPQGLLDKELEFLASMGVKMRYGVKVGKDVAVSDLTKQYDAVLLAVGNSGTNEELGIDTIDGYIAVEGATLQTSVPSVFAAGEAVRSNKWVVRSIVSGRNAACCIDQFLKKGDITGFGKPYSTRTSRLSEKELAELSNGVGSVECEAGLDGLNVDDVKAQADRCLHCDCGKQQDCTLRKYAEAYGAAVNRFKGPRRQLKRLLGNTQIVYEPGKCILCGTCVRISAESEEPLGLTFSRRGFGVSVDVPFDRPISAGLIETAGKCANACPTGAIVLRNDDNADLGKRSSIDDVKA